MEDSDQYEPTDEEKEEIERMLNSEDDQIPFKHRDMFTFNSNSHWIGWLKVHGIIW